MGHVDRRRFLAAAGSGALALAVDPWGLAARAGGIVPTALLTADLESHVAVVDLDTRRIVQRVETAPGPRSIESVGAGVAVVGHTEIGVVSILVSGLIGGYAADALGGEAPYAVVGLLSLAWTVVLARASLPARST